MKNYKYIILSTFIFVFHYSNGQTIKDITTLFPLKWKTKIGVTTYRTNIIESNGYIYIGSNGEDRNSDDDALDGVYKIDAKTGKIKAKYSSQIIGDNDVTGIALANNKIYFGTDNYYFYCFDTESGNELWKFAVPYDVESKPALIDLNNDKIDDVVFCVQNYGVYALNGIDGSVIWEQNSFKSHQGNVPPLLLDCNNDGVDDVIVGMRGAPNSDEIDGFKMAHYGDYIICLNGINGKQIWANPTGAGIHTRLLQLNYEGETMIGSLDCYGEFHLIDKSGITQKITGFGYGQFSSPNFYNNKLIVKAYYVDISSKNFDQPEGNKYAYLTNRAMSVGVNTDDPISATSVIADVLGRKSQQLISLTEGGEIIILPLTGAGATRLKLPSGAEASAFIKDIDKDGKLEIIIAGLDGYLYCFDTKSNGKAYSGEF